jgi:hypothetical protein
MALVEPAARFHVAWEPKALETVIARSEDHPCFVQLFGYHVCLAAEGASTIVVEDAVSGIDLARHELDGQFATTWGRLRDQERDYGSSSHSWAAWSTPSPWVLSRVACAASHARLR